MSFARFKDLADCMAQMTAKYPDPNIRRQVCQRLMQESTTAAGAGSKPKPKPFGGK